MAQQSAAPTERNPISIKDLPKNHVGTRIDQGYTLKSNLCSNALTLPVSRLLSSLASPHPCHSLIPYIANRHMSSRHPAVLRRDDDAPEFHASLDGQILNYVDRRGLCSLPARVSKIQRRENDRNIKTRGTVEITMWNSYRFLFGP